MTLRLKIVLSVVLLVVVAIASLTVGTVGSSMMQIIGIEPLTPNSPQYNILFGLRLPRTLTAIAVGAMLSMSGTLMQGIFRNPLVEPYTLGLSGGAVLGVALVFTLGLAQFGGATAVMLGAMVGALLSMFAILVLRRSLHFDTAGMLLSGIMLSFACSSFTTLLMSLGTRETLASIMQWTIGSLDGASLFNAVVLGAVALLLTIVSPVCGNVLNALSVGELTAQHLGIDTRRTVAMLFVVATLLAAVSVATVGIMAFVGMIVPHVVRLCVGTDHRVVLPLSAVGGATFMLLCDLVARQIAFPRELPTGIISGIVGGAMFIYLTARKNVKRGN